MASKNEQAAQEALFVAINGAVGQVSQATLSAQVRSDILLDLARAFRYASGGSLPDEFPPTSS